MNTHTPQRASIVVGVATAGKIEWGSSFCYILILLPIYPLYFVRSGWLELASSLEGTNTGHLWSDSTDANQDGAKYIWFTYTDVMLDGTVNYFRWRGYSLR